MSKKRSSKFDNLLEQERTENDQADIFPDKVPVEQLRAIWNDETVQYSDEQLYKIRDWVYTLAAVIIDIAEQQPEDNNIIKLNPASDEKQESNFICEGKYRRAS